jgi:hypothetical protein
MWHLGSHHMLSLQVPSSMVYQWMCYAVQLCDPVVHLHRSQLLKETVSVNKLYYETDMENLIS